MTVVRAAITAIMTETSLSALVQRCVDFNGDVAPWRLSLWAPPHAAKNIAQICLRRWSPVLRAANGARIIYEFKMRA